MPEDVITRLDSGQQTIVNEVLARQWATRGQIEATVNALLNGGLEGPINRALLDQRLITRHQAERLEEFLHTHLTFGEFAVTRRIGAGAMGDVYLARRGEDGEMVAIKAINSRYAGVEQFAKRFQPDIDILKGIHHPNVARAVAHGVENGLPYLALEHVPGPSLAALLDRHGPLPEPYVLQVAVRAAAGLEHIYDQTGLVHRDLKPENILTTHQDGDLYEISHVEDGVKLIDFGLARSYEADERLTMTGVTMGTPHYMSPEQIRGSQQVDHRSDIYALCATMYHLLTGHTPFKGGSPGEVMTAHLTEAAPDPGDLVPSLSAATCRLISTGLAKQPDERFASYRAFCKACNEALDGFRDGKAAGPRMLRKPLVLSKPQAAKNGRSGKNKPDTTKHQREPTPVDAHPQSHGRVRTPRPGSIDTLKPPSERRPLRVGDTHDTDAHDRSDQIRRAGAAQLDAESQTDPGTGILPLVVLTVAVLSLAAILVYRFVL